MTITQHAANQMIKKKNQLVVFNDRAVQSQLLFYFVFITLLCTCFIPKTFKVVSAFF